MTLKNWKEELYKHSPAPQIEMIKWYCPECSTEHYDFPDQGTHCGHCGRVIWVGNESHQIWDEGWSINIAE